MRSTGHWPQYIYRQLPEDVAAAVVSQLVRDSCWFSVTPLPDGVYELCVKWDREAALDAALHAQGFAPQEAMTDAEI